MPLFHKTILWIFALYFLQGELDAWVGEGNAVFISQAEAAESNSTQRYEFTEVHMAMPIKLALYCDDKVTANRAAKAVFARFAELNSILSDYDSASELSRLSHSSPHASPVKVSPDLWIPLAFAQQLASQTDGAFDVTVGPLTQLWRRSRRQRELPSDKRLQDALSATGYQHLKLNHETQTVQLLRPKMQLDLGGIAVGYAVDESLAILKRHGIHSAMIDASGDIGVSNAPPGETGWRIGIMRLDGKGEPTQFLRLANAALTTSGGAFQFVEIAGKQYSHIVDPKTGLGSTVPAAVTIVAPDCITADTFATTVSVLGAKKGLELVEKTPGVAAYILRGDQQHPEKFESARWLKLNLEKP